MNRAALIEKVAAMLAGAAQYGSMSGLMQAQEREDGNRVLMVGATQPFAIPAEDWEHGAVISITLAGEVRLVAVLAKKPGSGALRRLVAAIRAASLTPVIIEPVGLVMPAILRHWRWRCTVRGRGFESVREWRPA